jgi:hypothetical protein
MPRKSRSVDPQSKEKRSASSKITLTKPNTKSAATPTKRVANSAEATSTKSKTKQAVRAKILGNPKKKDVISANPTKKASTSSNSKMKKVSVRSKSVNIETLKNDIVERIFRLFVVFVNSQREQEHLEYFASSSFTLDDDDEKTKIHKGDKIFTVYVKKLRDRSFEQNMLNFDSMSINVTALQGRGIRTLLLNRIIDYLRKHDELKKKFRTVRIANSITEGSRAWMEHKGRVMGFQNSVMYSDSYEMLL